MNNFFRFLLLSCLFSIPQLVADRYVPINTQAPGREPLSPEEAAAAMRLPEGFSATLFAGEPDVRQPIAMKLDDRGRVWVAESYSYKEWEMKGEDRVLIFEDSDNDGRFDTLEEVVAHYARAAEWEIEEFNRVVTDYEIARGFERA